ncbi:Hypothetical protein GbCGDNIH9_0650 [Granulibacter bethesdensis]|uniref:Uncharacterized protein n=1 Tax=Granulibacter bethesdensis TaxID=364410 RepID=A0AAC9KDB8_9PROT|nr:Hypothetical protein GbCGDNIH9_0650 [Granulibacter bethesdensis]APH61473.1 Hypothetical protein GbCGDNIH8_0650 [Granulibacter bethesdensis]
MASRQGVMGRNRNISRFLGCIVFGSPASTEFSTAPVSRLKETMEDASLKFPLLSDGPTSHGKQPAG